MVTIKKYLILSILQKTQNADFVKFQLFNTDYFINKNLNIKILILKKFIIDLKIRIYISAVEKGL